MCRPFLPPPVRIRKALPEDAVRLRPLVAAMHAHEGLPMGPAVDAALATLLADPAAGFVLLAEAPELAGYVVVGFGYSLEFHGRDAFVDELFVLEARRGRGLGQALLEEAEASCRTQGIQAIHLEVDVANEHAHRLYARTGYAAHPRHLLTKWLTPRDAADRTP